MDSQIILFKIEEEEKEERGIPFQVLEIQGKKRMASQKHVAWLKIFKLSKLYQYAGRLSLCVVDSKKELHCRGKLNVPD